MAELELRNFSFAVPGRARVQASGTLRSGERVVLRGPSGCGKSTFLRALAGLSTDVSGEAKLDGQVLSSLSLGERGIGFVFQGGALFGHLTVGQNLAFGLKYFEKTRAWSEALRHQRVEEWLKTVGLEGYAERGVDALSGGERQRVALARTLIVEPKMVLLDEPLSAVDPARRAELQSWIVKLLSDAGAIALLVTHDAEEARVLGTRTVEWSSETLSF